GRRHNCAIAPQHRVRRRKKSTRLAAQPHRLNSEAPASLSLPQKRTAQSLADCSPEFAGLLVEFETNRGSHLVKLHLRGERDRCLPQQSRLQAEKSAFRMLF